MRRFGLGLATALLMAMLAQASVSFAASDGIDPAQRQQGMKEAPAAVAAAQLPCTVADARFMGQDDKTKSKYYEVACNEGTGFVLAAKDKAPPDPVIDCVVASAPGPDGKPGSAACQLPKNRNMPAQLQPFVARTGKPCTVQKDRYAGSTAQENIYEISCAEGGGYIMEIARNYGGGPKLSDCVDYPPEGSVKCTLITRAEQFAAVDKLAVASGKPCSIKDRRYVGSTSDGDAFYEIACADGSGFMIKADSAGKFAQAIDCAKASYIGNGCALIDTKALMAQQIEHYTTESKAAGFDCDVSKFAAFPSRHDYDMVELACSNRPDGGVGYFATAGGKSRVQNCLRASAEGYQCTMTPIGALFSSISAQLKAKGRGSCVVSNARPLAEGQSTAAGEDDFVEVSCADGGPGLVLQYTYGIDAPTDIMNCVQAASIGGGCKLPRVKS